MTQKQTDALDLLKWVVNVLILVVGFFVASKLKAVDKLEERVHQIEYWQAGDIERDIQAMQKLDRLIDGQSKAAENWAILDQRIDDLLISNPELKRP